MKLQILGCGASTGVPIVGCHCHVCSSKHPFQQRMRPSALITLDGGENILIDTSPDLRQQALTFGLDRIDATLLTHLHADHIMGLDELRIFNYLKKGPVDIFGYPDHLKRLKQMFSYIFKRLPQKGGGKPELITHGVTAPFELFGAHITPIPLKHGRLRTTGWRIDDFAYIVDLSELPEDSEAMLQGVKKLVIGALRHEPHSTHLNIAQAISISKKIGAERTVITHMGHQIDYFTTSTRMPKGVELGYDGMIIEG